MPADRHYEASLFGHSNEMLGHNQALVRMAPPYQSLESAHAAGRQMNNGLVEHTEFLPVDRPPQIGFELKEIYGARMHSFIEDYISGFSKRFRLIHRRIGVSEQIVRLLVPRVGESYSDACRGEVFKSRDIEWSGQLVQNPLGDLYGFSGILDVIQENGKFIAAEPRDPVARSQAISQPVGNAY